MPKCINNQFECLVYWKYYRTIIGWQYMTADMIYCDRAAVTESDVNWKERPKDKISTLSYCESFTLPSIRLHPPFLNPSFHIIHTRRATVQGFPWSHVYPLPFSLHSETKSASPYFLFLGKPAVRASPRSSTVLLRLFCPHAPFAPSAVKWSIMSWLSMK